MRTRPLSVARRPAFYCWGSFVVLLLASGSLWAAVGAPPGASFPPPLESYQDGHLGSVAAVLKHRVEVEPFNLVSALLFLAAVLHTFFTHKFRRWAHVLEERESARQQSTPEAGSPSAAGMGSRLFHFLGEVEAVFGLWVLPLALLMTIRFGHSTTAHYLNHRVNYEESLFVVVIMAMSATRPVLRLAAQCLSTLARLGGGGISAWWFSILTVGPLLGSLITEPAAMTISASLLARQFYCHRVRPVFGYATLGLLFVNVSVGGTLTHFAAPPVLMVAAPWGWGTPHMLTTFGWKAVVGIVISNVIYFLWFRKDFVQLGGSGTVGDAAKALNVEEVPVPAWVSVCHLLFMAFAVVCAHAPALLLGSFLFFLAFCEVTKDYQTELQLRPAILVGFFLAGLVIHGGLQQWWIAPVLGGLREVPLLLSSIGLTAFNDNAAITYLATFVPNLPDAMKYAVVAGAVAGGGLTVIANAPNPAGQAILGKYFPDGVAPLGLLLGALIPTGICTLCFLLFR